jgi:putative ABC transport system permease protein
MQFLIESASLALIGGAIGVMGGILVGKIITLVVGFPTAVPIWAIFLGLFLATAVGIFFGVYPASKAAKLDPIVALRAEL